eukprot:TRINITY_DN4380_c0_g1_i3.p1 TRINITY_DN4380_c0_g1~~TRINITY_DN4380_c0_g1_i3.p1  ORF type:complete len:436 (-),score=86.53 TRINITY_DN4380_c0_g1_i3:11-1318(-)
MDATGSPDNKLILVLCGMPARGKTYIARKVTRYLKWIGFQPKLFNVGNYRRFLYGTDISPTFFDEENADGMEARARCRKVALEDMANFLRTEGNVAIFDGTLTTGEKRRDLKETLNQLLPGVYVLWLESVCTDEALIRMNIEAISKAPDFVGKSCEEAYENYSRRISSYEATYQTLSPKVDGVDASFVRLINFGHEVEVYNVNGYIQSKIVSYVMNLNPIRRPIYFSRHGQSEYNKENRVGGDSDLTESGVKYAEMLNLFFQQEVRSGELKHFDKSSIRMFTSTLVRAVHTTSKIKLGVKPMSLKILDEINTGLCDGLTYDEIREKYPLVDKERKEDKLRYRYPRGESYLDIIHRIEPVIFEIERCRGPVIVIAHQGILRCLYAYFAKFDIPEIPHIDIPLHNVYKMIPDAYDVCLLYTSPSPRDRQKSRMPSSA